MARIARIGIFSMIIGSAGAHFESERCMFAVMEGIEELTKAGTFLYSAVERCESTNDGEEIAQCSSDIFSTIEYVLRASSFMVKSIEACGAGHEHAKECTLTTLKLASAASGLTATSLEMSKSCKHHEHEHGKEFPLDDNVACMGNIAASITGLGSTVSKLLQVKKKCEDKAECYAETMEIIATVAEMGEAIWSTFSGSCIINKALEPYEDCVVAFTEGTKDLMELGSSALLVSEDCKMTEPSALYEVAGTKASTISKFTPANLALTALLPLTGAAAFVRGTRDAKHAIADGSGQYEPVIEMS